MMPFPVSLPAANRTRSSPTGTKPSNMRLKPAGKVIYSYCWAKAMRYYQVLASGANYFNEKEIVGELSRKIARQRTEGSEK